MSTLSERVAAALAQSGLSQAELARACKVTPVSVNDWLSGKTRSMKAETAIAAASALNVSASWLARGFGDPQHGQRPPSDGMRHANTEPGPPIRGAVPLISWVQAGHWCEVIDNFAPGDAEEWLPCPVKHGARTFVLRVRGESMWNPHGRPSFQDGDLIFVDPDRDPVHGSMVVVRLDDEREATFKQLVVEGSRRYLRAANPSWPDKILQIDGDATICGVVIFKGERV
jgi:SOS-response transcriptional repressor LexA